MIGRVFYGACAITLVTATAVIAQPSDSGSNAQNNANKQICRTMADTGSRLARYRACHTAQEWIELRRQTKQNVDRIQNSRAMNGPG